MKSMHVVFPIIMMFLTSGLVAQEASATDQKPHLKKNFELTFFMGKSYGGPISGFQSAIKASNLTDASSDPNGIYGYSQIHKRPPFAIELKLNVTQRSGIAFRIGREDVIHAATYPNVNCRLRNASFNYVYKTPNNRHEFSVGPSFLSLNLKSADHIYGKTSKKRTGINVGYSFHFIETRGFFMAFHTHYTWAGKATIGPYTLRADPHQYYLLGLFPLDIKGATAQVPSSEVNLNTLNVGFSVGIRFGVYNDASSFKKQAGNVDPQNL